MPKFRKKPIIIDAEQYTLKYTPRGVAFDAMLMPYVETIHLQRVYIKDSDWVVVERDGKHFYPITDEIFKETYEPV